MKDIDKMEKADCEVCGWEGTIDDLDCGRYRIPVCPSCWSDEINYAENTEEV